MPGPIAARSGAPPSASAPDSTIPRAGRATPREGRPPRPPVLRARARRKAVGGEQHERPVALLCPEPVAALERRAGPHDPAPVGLQHLRTVRLPGHGRGVGVDPDQPAEQPAVLDHALGLVVGEDPEVQRLVRALADAAETRREDDPVRVSELRLEDHGASISSRAAASSASRPSSSPFTFRRRISSRIAPTWGDSVSPSSARSPPEISRWTSRVLEIADESQAGRLVSAGQGHKDAVGVVRLGHGAQPRGARPWPRRARAAARHRDGVGNALAVAAPKLEALEPVVQSSEAAAGPERPAAAARQARRAHSAHGECRARRRAPRPPRRRPGGDGSPGRAAARPSAEASRRPQPPRGAPGARPAAAPRRALPRAPSQCTHARGRTCARPCGSRTGSRSGSRGRGASGRR